MSMSSSRKMRRRLSVSSSESRVDRFRNMHGCTKQYYYYNNNDKKKDERYTVVSQIYCPLVSLLSSYLHSHFLTRILQKESKWVIPFIIWAFILILFKIVFEYLGPSRLNFHIVTHVTISEFYLPWNPFYMFFRIVIFYVC